jgi:hypothetical protein
MTTSEMAILARKVVRKNWDFDELKYGDDLYGKEKLADEVWDLVDECKKIGIDAFEAKYLIGKS